MKIALQASESDEHIAFVRSLGLRDVVCGMPAEVDGVVPLSALEQRRDRFAANELDWGVIENLSPTLYDEIMFGAPERERQLEGVCRTIENIGKVGIPVLQYQWMLLGGLRTEYSPTGRGGARYPRFDGTIARHMPAACLDWLGRGKHRYPHIPDRPLSAQQVWSNLEWFLKAVVPVAESAGVRLAAHPDDAPIAEYLGVARILIDVDSLQRVIDIVPSPNNGIGFCMGTIGTMAGSDVVDAIRRIGSQGKVFFSHFRNPRGKVPAFEEVFPDEGDIDMVAAVAAWNEVGFDGVIRIDHCPGVVGDNLRADRSFAFQVGYLRGLMQNLENMGVVQ
jgi:mannonate dehydratase